MKFLATLAMVQSVLVFGRPGWRDVNWDVLIFTQQWPITSCIDHKARHSGAFCNLYPNMTSWTVHGVWPTKLGTISPNYCNSSWDFNEHNIVDIEPFLIKYWANIFAEDSRTSLWKHEWSKHGTCAAQLPSLNSQLKYFKKGLQWVTQYDIVSALAKHMIYPNDTTTYTVVAIADAIQDMFGTRPAVDCVYNKERHEHELAQIKVCFDKTLKLVHCDGIMGASGLSVIGNCPQSKGIVYPGSVRFERSGVGGGTSLNWFADLSTHDEIEGNVEQCYAIKFCIKPKKTKQKAYGVLQEACEDELMSKASFYKWFSKFSKGNEQVKDGLGPGVQNTAYKEESIDEVRSLMM